jgi:hypothetical protein
MRISTLFRRSADAVAACCGSELAHCHETLVLHADGAVECDGEDVCGLDELQHDQWVACDELGCGCAGDDAPVDSWLLAA